MRLHRIFFYLTLLLLPTQLGYHFWPDWAMVLGRRLDYLAPTIFLTDITIVLTLGGWFLSLVFSRLLSFRPTSRNLKMPDQVRHDKFKSLIWRIIAVRKAHDKQQGCSCKKNLIVFLFLCLFISLNILFASSPIIVFFKWFKFLEFVLFGLYIVRTKPSFSRSLWCLSVAVLYSSVIAIAQFYFQHSLDGIFWFLGERTFDISTPGISRIQSLVFSISNFKFQISNSSEVIRAYATFPHPNVLGGFLAILLPLLFFNYRSLYSFPELKKFQFREWKSTYKKILLFIIHYSLFIIIPLGLLALFLTFSRSAWVACILLFVFLKICNCNFISNFKFQTCPAVRRVSYLLSMGLVLVVGFFILPYFLSLTPDSESVYVRNELNTSALSIWWNNSLTKNSFIPHTSYVIPRLFGVGLGNYLVELPKYFPHRDIFFLQPVHNIYLLVLSETGIIGFFIFIYCLIKIIIHKARMRLFVICHLSFVILLLLGAVDHYPLTLQQGQLLFCILFCFMQSDYIT